MAERELSPDQDPFDGGDPFTGLRELAHRAEGQATPIAVHRVRQLGARRRQRRHVAVGTLAALAVFATGGVMVSQSGLLPGRGPDPAAPSPSFSAVPATPTPARTVTTANLLEPTDIPVQGEQIVEVTPDGVGRAVAQSSVCLPSNGLASLSATAVVSRNFRYSTAETDDPSILTQALQFGSAAEAEQAMTTYQDWLSVCGSTLVDNGWVRIGEVPSGTGEDVLPWFGYVDTADVVSGYSEVPTYRAADDTSENGWFESVGLTRVDDRLMVTVYLVYSSEFHYENDPDGGVDSGLPAHPQYALLRAAAERLAS